MVDIMGRNRTLVFGVGINDSEYKTHYAEGGKFKYCSIYLTWRGMIKRCHDKKWHLNKPSYKGCSVCDEWLKFSNFKLWMDSQDWKGKELDKDLLVNGNKVYSPENCVFVNKLTNSFILDRSVNRGLLPIGVDFYFSSGKFRSQCSNPFTKKHEHLGYFACQHQAHLAWRKRKHELACQLADLQTDDRVAEALRTRYL
jgi:hypothetical protein